MASLVERGPLVHLIWRDRIDTSSTCWLFMFASALAPRRQATRIASREPPRVARLTNRS
jgi:hypothetical protein